MSELAMRICEVCGISGINIEVREIWHDGEYFGTFCGQCEIKRGTRQRATPAVRTGVNADPKSAARRRYLFLPCRTGEHRYCLGSYNRAVSTSIGEMPAAECTCECHLLRGQKKSPRVRAGIDELVKHKN